MSAEQLDNLCNAAEQIASATGRFPNVVAVSPEIAAELGLTGPSIYFGQDGGVSSSPSPDAVAAINVVACVQRACAKRKRGKR
jgi:hypothetical protein